MDALSLALMMFGIAIVIIVAVIFVILNMKVLSFFPTLDLPEFFLTL